MSRSDLDYLRHVRDEAAFLESAAAALGREAFLRDELRKRAFVRSLEIIGEATKKVSAETRADNPAIDWRGMAGMRDRLIHDYFGVDYELVWDVVVSKIPELAPRDRFSDWRHRVEQAAVAVGVVRARGRAQR